MRHDHGMGLRTADCWCSIKRVPNKPAGKLRQELRKFKDFGTALEVDGAGKAPAFHVSGVHKGRSGQDDVGHPPPRLRVGEQMLEHTSHSPAIGTGRLQRQSKAVG